MFRNSSDSETEVLLGNKQLLGIFFIIVVLFGVFFAAGFLTGRGGLGRRLSTANSSSSAASADSAVKQAELRTADESRAGAAPTKELPGADETNQEDTPARPKPGRKGATSKHILPADAPKASSVTRRAADTPAPSREGAFTPDAGQTYLQVAALGRSEAEAVADVLSRKGFRAHIAPRPGEKFFRVLVGPVHDAGDLSATRDALMKTGFREVLVRRY